MKRAVLLFAGVAIVCGCVVDVPPLMRDTENDSASDGLAVTADTGSGWEVWTSDWRETEFDSEPVVDGEEDFVQSADENGLVIMEAEDYSDVRAGKEGSMWKASAAIDGYSGEGAMRATHFRPGYTDNTDPDFAEANAPVLRYTVKMVKAAPAYVWLRAAHEGASDDSVWFGTNGHIATDSALSFQMDEQTITDRWYYIRYLMDGTRAVLDVPAPGVLQFELYMREVGLEIDQIVLTINKNFNPNWMTLP